MSPAEPPRSTVSHDYVIDHQFRLDIAGSVLPPCRALFVDRLRTLFPIDRRDLFERNIINPNTKCGFYFTNTPAPLDSTTKDLLYKRKQMSLRGAMIILYRAVRPFQPTLRRRPHPEALKPITRKILQLLGTASNGKK